MYYSSWCSVADVNKSNEILGKLYNEEKNMNEEVITPYTNWVGKLNFIAMIALLVGFLMFFYFAYANINLYKNLNILQEKKEVASVIVNSVKSASPANGKLKSKPTKSGDVVIDKKDK